MSDLNTVLAAHREAVAALLAVADGCGRAWTTPRAPGKWSPSQLVEHVAVSLDEAANVVSGSPSKFPALPVFLRPVLRALLFNRVLKKGAFPKARTGKAFNPAVGPATPTEARTRLEAALARFDRQCRACAEKEDTVSSATFGVVRLTDYARFIELHTRHHTKQLPSLDASREQTGSAGR